MLDMANEGQKNALLIVHWLLIEFDAWPLLVLFTFKRLNMFRFIY